MRFVLSALLLLGLVTSASAAGLREQFRFVIVPGMTGDMGPAVHLPTAEPGIYVNHQNPDVYHLVTVQGGTRERAVITFSLVSSTIVTSDLDYFGYRVEGAQITFMAMPFVE